MQIQKPDIKESIRLSAMEEFYTQGYKFATMRKIAENAKIPTGLIYTYYKNKEAILDDILSPLYNYMHESFFDKDKNDKGLFYEEETKEIEIEKLINLIKWHKELVILGKKANGSKYANAKDLIIDNVVKYIEYGCSAYHKEDEYAKKYGELFPRIIAVCYVESLITIAENYVNIEEAELYIRRIFDILYVM